MAPSAASDEYVLDTPTCGAFIADVRAAIARGRVAPRRLRRDPAGLRRAAGRAGWLPDEYRGARPSAGWAAASASGCFRAADRSLSLFSLVVPPAAQTPVHDHLAWGSSASTAAPRTRRSTRDDGASSCVERRSLAPGRLLRAASRRATTSTACARPRPRRRSRSTCSRTTPAACGATPTTPVGRGASRSGPGTSTSTARREAASELVCERDQRRALVERGASRRRARSPDS